MALETIYELKARDINLSATIEGVRESLRRQLADLRKIKDEGSDAFKALTQKVAETKKELGSLAMQQKEVERSLKLSDAPKDSLIALRLEYSKLMDQIARLSSADLSSKMGQDLIKNAAGVKQAINTVEESVGRFTGSVGNYEKGLLKLGDLVTGGLITGGIVALVQGFERLGSKVIDINSEVSDKIADVAKAANVSVEFVNSLSEALKGRDTRTSLVDQLGIAEIGGKLGVASKDLYSFVDAVDVVNVALGDQFGGSVELTTETIGKLRNVLLDVKSADISKNVVNIGNALNFLEAQGAASAGTIADFAGRIGGVASPLGVSAGAILGVSATMDELAINAERGSTAFIKLLQRVAQSPGDFARVAGVSSKEFTDLVNNDIFGAVQLFIGKLNDKNLSNTELQTALKSLKLTGVGVSEVVGKLGGNLDLLSNRVAQSTQALTESSSVTQEFEKKNATLGASVEKLENAFANLLTNSGFSSFFGNLIQDFTGLIAPTEKLSDSLRVQQTEFNGLVNILKDVNTSESTRNAAIAQLQSEYPDYIGKIDLHKATETDLNKILDEGNQIFAQRIFLQSKEEQILEFEKKRAQIQKELFQAEKLQQEAGTTRVNRQIDTEGKNIGTVTDESAAKAFAGAVESRKKALAELDKAQKDFLKEQDDFAKRFNLAGPAPATTPGGAPTPGGTTFEDTGAGKGTAGKTKKEAEGAIGSIKALKKEIEGLNKQIEAAPPDATILNPLVAKLVDAETRLKLLEARLEALKNPQKTAVDDQAAYDAQAAKELGKPSVSPEIDRANAVAKARVEIDAQTNQEILKQQGELSADSLKATAAQLEAEQKLKEQKREAEKKRIEEIKAGALDIAGDVLNGIIETEKQKQQEGQEKRLNDLDKEYAKKLKNAQGNVALEEKLQNELQKKKELIEKQGAKERQKIAIKEAIIQGALGVIKALPNFVLAGFVALATAVQVAFMTKQQFAAGGMRGKSPQYQSYPAPLFNSLPELSGGGHTGNGLNYVDGTGRRVAGRLGNDAVVHEGEYVLNAEQVRRYPQLVSFLDSDRMRTARPYADGGFNGVVRAGLPGGSSGAQRITAEFNAANVELLAETMATKTAQKVSESVYSAARLGQKDANRLEEREAILSTNRAV